MTPAKLKKLRQGLELTQQQAADQVLVSLRTWTRYESGETEVTERTLALFCLLNDLDYQIKDE